MKVISRFIGELLRFPIVFIWKNVMGWRITRDAIEDDKLILAGSPHTSNWDYLIFLVSALSVRRKVYVTIKKELFFPPLGWLLRALGGIPIDRHATHNLVEELTQSLNEADRMILLFTPDGTRSYRPYWKTGFYWVAVETGLPIMLAIPNFKEKTVYLDYKFMPTGDIEADFIKIREQLEKYGYGLYPKNVNPVITRAAYEAELMDIETDISALKRADEQDEREELSA